ncbi:nuclear transport factor 2 family protein [Streptomyces sp. NPDC086549]|uniref:nuclear transport factor 2 family protein n=1 Tax=Streptomyces sp. NPDC086549 TaxID=3365752 RepID=UPI00381F796D
MTAAEKARTSLKIVRELYEAAFRGDADAFPAAMHEDFEESVPPALPWGGIHRGPDAFKNQVLPLLSQAVDFSTMRLESLSADGDHVAALLTAKSSKGDDLHISEHWTLRDGKVWRMRVFYHDTAPLLAAAE